jgi:S-phase kinase-associated protein 1
MKFIYYNITKMSFIKESTISDNPELIREQEDEELLSSSSSTSSTASSSSSSSEDSSDSDVDQGPSRWQHWEKWQGPWYKKNMLNNKIIPRSGKTVNLLPCDSDNTISISMEAVALSPTIQNMINDFGTDNTSPIPLVEITTITAKKIVEYLEYLYDNPKNTDWNINTKQEFSDWEKQFREVDYNLLDDLCLASNFLDIKPLLKLCCNRIAMILENIEPENMGHTCAELFGTANDIPEDEYKQMMEDHDKYFTSQ